MFDFLPIPFTNDPYDNMVYTIILGFFIGFILMFVIAFSLCIFVSPFASMIFIFFLFIAGIVDYLLSQKKRK
jgi:hypothetical protein